METRIGKHNFQSRPGGRVPGDHAVDIVANVLEKHATQHDMIPSALAQVSAGVGVCARSL